MWVDYRTNEHNMIVVLVQMVPIVYVHLTA